MTSHNNSDTPRTDAFELAFMQKPLRYNEEMVMAIWDCHRTLERELNETNRIRLLNEQLVQDTVLEIEQLRADLKMCAEALQQLQEDGYKFCTASSQQVLNCLLNPRIQAILNEK